MIDIVADDILFVLAFVHLKFKCQSNLIVIHEEG